MAPVVTVQPLQNQLEGLYHFADFSGNFRGITQGWEFAHRFSEQIAPFLSKNEQMSDLLKKMSDSLIRSFLVSDLSYSLTLAHFL